MSVFSSFVFRFTRCESCNRGDSPSLSHCTRCLSVAFCNVECQRAAWPTHKRGCRSLGAETVRALQVRADSGDGAALADLGTIYFRGLCGVAPNRDAALTAWSRGAAAGDAPSIQHLDKVSEPGAARIVLPPASRASPEHGALVGQRRTFATAAHTADAGDVTRAIALYEECAAGPSLVYRARSLYGLGLIFTHGQGGMPQDEERAGAYFCAAADAAVAANAAGLSDAGPIEAEMLMQVVLYSEFIRSQAGSEFLREPASSVRACAVMRSLPLILRAWALDPLAVSPFLRALVAVGYATGAGAPCDVDEAVLWVGRSYSEPPTPEASNLSAIDARQSDALESMQESLEYLESSASPHAAQFERAILDLYVRVAAAWAGSLTDTSRTAAWWLARRALASARAGYAPFPFALNTLKLAAAEGVGCAAHMLYTAFSTGTDGAEASPAAAAHWAARCRALGHAVEASHAH